MHLRKLILVAGFASALLSNMAAALGLGEVRLNSTLNEPLNAEIKLLDTRGLSNSQVIVGLASPADYERNGVDRLYFFTEFQFEILLNHPGGAIVRVTSHNPVREPFLNFLVEARWPTGRLLREYTLLMDLPTFAESPSQAPALAATTVTPSATPSTQATTPSSQPSRPAASSLSTSPSAAPAPRRSSFAGDSYTVGARDTLWQIALDVRPDSSHSVHQTMLAIQRLNPEAFIDGNINLLRQGQVLRVPSSEDIQTLSRRDAVNEVARQNRAWSDSDLGAQLSASRNDASTGRDSTPLSGSVKLATPSNDDAFTGQGSGDNAGSGRALESQLTSSLEELDKSRSENLELSARVRDLEEQIQTMERLAEVKNEQLRALELAIKQGSEQPAESLEYETEPVTAPESYTADADSYDSEQPATEQTDVEDTAVTAEVTPEPEVVPAPIEEPPVVFPPRPAKTLVDHVMENITWVLLGVVSLLVIVGVVLHRRRQKSIEQEFASDDNLFDMSGDEAEQGLESEIEGDAGEENYDEFDATEEEIHTEAETGDVVSEADIYIAYGKLDQAEEMLLKGLEREPNSIDIRLKLLEVYSHAQDAPKFDRYYAGLIGVAGQASLARAAELRAQIQGAGKFDTTEVVEAPVDDFGGIDLAETDDAIDLDSIDFDEPGPVAAAVVAQDDDLDFSFDLDDEPLSLEDEGSFTDESDLRSSGASSYDLSFDAEQSVPAVANDEELAFELDLDDEPAALAAATSYDETGDGLDDLEFSLDDDELVVDEPAPAPVQSVVSELEKDDFSFDFESTAAATDTSDDLELALDEDLVELEAEDSDTDEAIEDLQLPEDQTDDFNLDMDMGDLDLAALDHEMESLDADFGDLDADEPVAKLDRAPVAKAPIADMDSASDEDVFDEALSGLSSADLDADDLPEMDDSDEDMDGDLDFLADADEAATKLDLARAYIDMGDTDGARDILAEVAHEGNDEQRQEAVDLLSRIDA